MRSLVRSTQLAAVTILGLVSGSILVGCASNGGPPAPSEVSSLRTAAETGEARYGVPADLVLALAWAETRWSLPERESDDEHGAATLGIGGLRASALLDGVLEELALSSDDLRTDAPRGILATSAYLRALADARGLTPSTEPSEWREVLADHAGLDGREGQRFADYVLGTLERGLAGDAITGEHIVLAARPIPAGSAPEVALEYGGAEYPGATWSAASSSNYTDGRGGHRVRYIVIHDTEGSYAGAISWFRNPASSVSAHYVIRSSDGDITQMLRESDTGWHAGNWTYNQESIGIEHEGFYRDPARWYTEAMYVASAALVRTLCMRYGVPMDRAHIIAHSEVPGASHVDPGPGWNWDHYMDLVRGEPARPAYDATAGARSIPAEMVAGERAVAWLELVNTGGNTWDIGSTRVGTSSPQDHDSPFFDMENWINRGRATGADHDYATGATGRFSFMIHAPEVTTDTVITDHVRLVQEGVTWFGPEMTLSVMVHPRAPTDGDLDGTASGLDCDDADPTRHPGASEVCGDGVDQDCDGSDSTCTMTTPDAGPGGRDAEPAGDGGTGPTDPRTRGTAGGCSAAPGRGGAMWMLAPLLLAFAMRRARRS